MTLFLHVALGAVLMLFGLGNVQDPANNVVREAKALQPEDDDDTGDPPNTPHALH